ncbi:hypothetical protein Anapl_10434 [Anas platyrhynchos]|uniref:Uncharacterized protein n=1 Tax=Anas platyrhynchos TaxID=8839 RepID=R0LMB4_ANAPL|nr:hypothetical protein Anapl_10434 [Anas platyrhynchos]
MLTAERAMRKPADGGMILSQRTSSNCTEMQSGSDRQLQRCCPKSGRLRRVVQKKRRCEGKPKFGTRSLLRATTERCLESGPKQLKSGAPSPRGFLGPEEGGRSRPHQIQSPVDLKHWLRLIAFPVSALGMKAASTAPSASGQA